jgi:hypothetical protein
VKKSGKGVKKKGRKVEKAQNDAEKHTGQTEQGVVVNSLVSEPFFVAR